MAPNWYLGRTGLVYAKEESTYASAPTFAATDAIRHLGVKLAFNPRQPAPSPERKTHPSQIVLYNRRQAADWELKTQMYPSGTLNTVPELAPFLKNGLGTVANTTLSTTLSGTPTTTTGTVGSATGLAASQMIQITIASGGNAGVYHRWLTSATSGTSLVWTPALPGAPVSGDAVKGIVTYSPATALAKSLDIAHYPQAPAASTPAREMLGCVVDKLQFDFDSNLEPMATFSGPAQGFAGSSPTWAAQAAPGAFTTVGSESGIPSGLTGYFYYGGTLYEIEKLQIVVNNAMDLQNTALGTNKAAAYFRKGKRKVDVKIDAKISDDTTIWTPSLATSSNALFLQLGTTSARIWSIYMPAVTLTNAPDFGDNDETNNWSFQGQALGVSGNDELYVAQG